MNTSRAPLRLAALSLLVALGACGPAGSDTESEEALIERARGIHERAIVLDTHDDINPANFTADRNYTMDLPTQVTLPKMEAGGTDVSWMVVYVGQGDLTPEGFAAANAEALEKFAAIHRLTEEIAPDRIELALTSDDVRRIVAAGKKVAMIGVENGYSIGTDISNIQKFQEMGARYMSLSHNGHSQLSDSNTGERDDVWLYHGLSDLGKQAVAELNRVGIMIDLSHPSRESNLQAIALSQAPVMASHSSARALNDVSRNLSDEELDAIEANGGVVQTVAFASYVNSAKNTAHSDAVRAAQQEEAAKLGVELLDRRAMFQLSEADRAAYQETIKPVEEAVAARMDAINAMAPPVDVVDFADHIDYLVNRIGIDHVGISSDFDGGGGVQGWNDASESFGVTLELVRRGYTEEEIGKMWSGNLLRVLDEVQAVAARLQAEG
jgi:microsomal dipeptidase-like Zn-dependent dipeptidase